MSMAGSAARGKAIRGLEDVLSISENLTSPNFKEYSIKQSLRLHIGAPVHKDSTAAGSLKHPGREDSYADLLVYAQVADLVDLNGYARNWATESNPDKLKFRIVYTDVTGGTSTVMGDGYVTSSDVIDSSPEQKVTINLHIEFDEGGATTT